MIPALGCGVAGFDLERGARLICEEIVSFDADSLAAVRFIAYDDEECRIINEVADDVRDTFDNS